MSRLVTLVLAGLVIFWLLRRALGSRGRADPPSRSADSGQGSDDAAPDLVACARCGVLVPKNVAFFGGDANASATGPYFCSEEHRRLGPG